MARPDTDMLNSCPCSGVCNGQLFSMSTACLQQFMGQLKELANHNEQFKKDT